MEILLDTNFLIISVEQKIQLFEQLEELIPSFIVLVPKQVIHELEKIKEDKELKIKEREAAQIAMDLIKRKKVKIIDLKTKNTDAGIVRYCDGRNVAVATLDRGLKDKIKEKDSTVKFLTVRQKRRLAIQ